MADRAYTVKEIDEMRGHLWTMYAGVRPDVLEGYLRTHMLNGTSVQELREAAEEYEANNPPIHFSIDAAGNYVRIPATSDE